MGEAQLSCVGCFTGPMSRIQNPSTIMTSVCARFASTCWASHEHDVEDLECSEETDRPGRYAHSVT